MENNKSIENMSFEEALAELEQIVRKIDTGSQTLADAIKDFERGMALKKYCEAKLQEAKLVIEKITTSENGEVKTEPL